MGSTIKKYVGLSVLTVLFLLLSTQYFLTAYSVSAEIPRISEFCRSRTSDGIPFSTYERLPNESFSYELSVSAQLNTAPLGESGDSVKPVLVNENYFDIYGMHVEGSAIKKSDIDARSLKAVVSDRIAKRISSDGDVIGQSIRLFDEDFTVIGVCKTPSGFLRKIATDIYDRVYLPYTCLEEYPDIPIDAFAAPKGSNSEKTIPLLGITGTDTEFYIENDLYIKRDVIANFVNLFVCVIALILAVEIIRLLAYLFQRTGRKLREEYQTEKLSAVLWQNKLYLLLRVLLAVFLAAIPVALLILFPPRLVLPPSYIPDDNIFEISHYLHVFADRIRLSNTGLSVSDAYYRHLYSTVLPLLSVAFAVLTILAVIIARTIRRRIREHISRDR